MKCISLCLVYSHYLFLGFIAVSLLSSTMSMNAVVIHGPRDIRIEKRPIPSIQEPRDAIVKVQVAGICGSELHPYRGHQTMSFGHIMARLTFNVSSHHAAQTPLNAMFLTLP